jgi:hypothetical protein
MWPRLEVYTVAQRGWFAPDTLLVINPIEEIEVE